MRKWIQGILFLLFLGALASMGAADQEPHLAKDGHGGYLLVRVVAQTDREKLVADYLDPDGKSLWGDEGMDVAPGRHLWVEDVRFTPGHEWVILWRDSTPAGDEWRAQALDSGGKRLWSDEGTLLHEAAGDAVNAVARMDASGVITLAWGEETAGRTQVHVQRWGHTGLPQWGTSGFLQDAAPPDNNHRLILTTTGDDLYMLWVSRNEEHPDWIVQRVKAAPKSF